MVCRSSNISFLETIKVVNGTIERVDYHQNRLNSTQKFHFDNCYIDLKEVLNSNIATDSSSKILKCSVQFSREVESITFQQYSARDINSFKAVEDNSIDYRFKYSNRDRLNRLREERGECDEIIIVKEGLLTDTSYSNIILFDGVNWITPSTPLLRGTMRQHLLDIGAITEQPISIDELSKFSHIKMINAMLNIDDTEATPTSNIKL